MFRGIPVRSILQIYNSQAAQPVPSFAADGNYLRPELLKTGERNLKRTDCPEEKVEMNGRDITPEVEKAWDFLVTNVF